MLIYIIKNERLETYTLPLDISGSYWITDLDENNQKRNLINMEESNNFWKLTCNYDFDLYVNGEIKEEVLVNIDTFYFLKNHLNDEIIAIFCTKIYNELNYYCVNDNTEILIGRDSNCQINYNNSLIAMKHAKLKYQNNRWHVENLDKSYKTYVNGFAMQESYIPHGVVIFIMGLKIIPIGNTLIVNNPALSVSTTLIPKDMSNIINNDDTILEDDDPNVTVYKKSDYFNRAPRFRSKIETVEMTIDEPPSKEKEDDMPVLITIGPMMTMSMTAMVTLYTGITRATQSDQGISSALPSIVMGVAMIGTMLVWPLITKKYKAHKSRKDEIKRRDKYELYIQSKRQEIVKKITEQRQILNENFISLEECAEIIINRKPILWERKMEEDDFLTVRLGLGTVPLDIDIKYPQEKFTMEDDILKEIIRNLVDESKEVTGAPITVSLLEKRITGIVGQYNLTKEFMRGLLMQLITFYTGDILKIVILTNEQNSSNWESFKVIQHIWDNEKTNRFYATNNDEIKEVASYLEKEYSYREENLNEKEKDVYKQFNPYYLIITDDFKSIADYNFVKKILKSKDNLGFSMLISNDKLSNLPNECTCFININPETSGLIENELVSTNQKTFMAEFPNSIDIDACCLILANIPINIESKSKGLPDSYGFLELYNIGKVEQLNASNRWKANDPTISLSAPVGIDESGELFKIDLHEKFHGPHGLVAGTTGSGKSEWIITFILSMAINYSPNEVSFVLIDYKGGGLALAFENKELGIKLPHIAGTITNLDANELNRSLASIESELKRRQREFNKARDISGESTIDIYKYQKLYREGIVDKPISHLFIISDEFAELKAQQPEFMDQLVSTARIGRSLGVHLILATQKPAGVVNEQIWSNSRFKVCLKVQDKADSNDMIRVPDAAALKQAGRFYLLVGYNDYFAMGQAAYCGMPYIPSEKIKKKIDTSLNFINNVGYTVKSVDEIIKQDNVKNNGEVLLNVVKYLTTVANKENITVDQLWLDRIPNVIFVDDLKKKYNYQKENYIINPVIGEYDNPANQSQHLLTLPLSKEGNTIIYGMAGSGKEDLLSAICYSCITTYTTDELNMYIIDCGAETLKMFNNAPQIGNILLSNDTDHILNLFKMLTDIINQRKKLFIDYGGTLDAYNTYSDSRLPNIVVIINNYETFMENYESLEENIIQITRECVKYGITFITTSTTSNSIRFKLRQNFSQNIPLQLIDPYDYSNILGNVHKMKPSDNKGRGLVKLDEVYEFQSATVCNTENLLETIKNTCEQLNKSLSLKAQKIPVLPDDVDVTYVSNSIKDITNVPIGVAKYSLEISTFDFKMNYLSIISSAAINNTKNFINGLAAVISKTSNVKLMVFDLYKLVNSAYVDSKLYSNKSFDDLLSQLNSFVDDKVKVYEENDYDNSVLNKYSNLCVIIVGLDELFNRIKPDTKNNFTKTIIKAKALELINFVLIDTNDNLKKYQYDEWYKSNVKTNNGIWVGNGIAEQNVIKLSKMSRDLYAIVGNDFGYVVNEGVHELIKLVKPDVEATDDNIETLEL